MGLEHTSYGEGQDRHIVVTKGYSELVQVIDDPLPCDSRTASQNMTGTCNLSESGKNMIIFNEVLLCFPVSSFSSYGTYM